MGFGRFPVWQPGCGWRPAIGAGGAGLGSAARWCFPGVCGHLDGLQFAPVLFVAPFPTFHCALSASGFARCRQAAISHASLPLSPSALTFYIAIGPVARWVFLGSYGT